MDFTSKFVAGLIVCALLPTIAIGAQPGGLKVVKTVDLHTYSEDITYIRTGPHAKHVALIEDARVMAYPLTSQGKGSVKELFDLTGRIPRDHMNGLAYMESEKRFAIISRQFMDKIMVFEPNGKLQSERPITYPTGYVAGYVEGLEYIPPDAAQYPDHLVMCTGKGDGVTGPQTGDIMVLSRDGSVVKTIFLPPASWGCGGIAYRAPGELLVTGYNDGDWGIVTVIDFNGNFVAEGPDRIDPAGEGLVSLPDGNVLAVGSGGDVLMLGPDLRRKPEEDRTFRPTQGFSHLINGVAWNSLKMGFVLSGNLVEDGSHYALFDLPTAFAGAAKLADLRPRTSRPYFTPRRLTYLPAEGLIAMGQPPRNPPYVSTLSIQLFHGDNGDHYGQVDLTSALSGRGDIIGVAYLEAANQFAVTLNGSGERGKVQIVNRAGGYVRTIDYSGSMPFLITAVEFFPSGTQLLFTNGNGTTLYVGDLNGNITAQYPVSDIGVTGASAGVLDLALVTSGEYAGMFAAVDLYNVPYKLTIFTFDQPLKRR